MTNRIKQTVWRRVPIDSVFFALAICQTRSQTDALRVPTLHASDTSPDSLLTMMMGRRTRSMSAAQNVRYFHLVCAKESSGASYRPPVSPLVIRQQFDPYPKRGLRTVIRSKRKSQDDDAGRSEDAESGSHRLPDEDLEYWRSCMELADRPSAVRMLRKIDFSTPLGVKAKERAPGRKAETLLDVYMRTRKRHPRKVILCRVGDFYEAFGFCAVLLVQFAGLNPMGSVLPRAGCPVVNLRRTLQDLTDAGFSVVIMEEKPIPWGLKNRRKDRYIAGFATPASPIYVHDMSLSSSSSDLAGLEQAPIVGIASLSVRGFLLYEISLDTRACKVMEGLTEDAVLTRLTAARCSPPLYLHADLPPALASRLASMASHYHWRILTLPGTLSSTTDAAAPGSFLLALLDAVRLDLDLAPDDVFTVATTTSDRRPRPLYLTTAAQVGVLPKEGIPSLVDALVPTKTEALVKAFLRRWLLHPPPPDIARELRAAVTHVQGLPPSAVLPAFPVLSAARIARFVSAGEANIAVLSDLHAALAATLATLEDEKLCGLSDGLLTATRFETGVGRCDAESVTAAASEVTADVAATVILRDAVEDAATEEGGAMSDEADKERESEEADKEGEGEGQEQEASEEEGAWFALERLVLVSETFAGKIHRRCAEDTFVSVDRARGRLRAAVRDELLPVVRKLNEGKTKTAKKRARVQLDAVNLAVWVKAGSGVSKEQAAELQLFNPRDRMAKLITDAYVTEEALDAIAAYRQACEDASEQVRTVLRSLSARISKRLPEVINGVVFCTLAKTVVLHVQEASRKRWCVPAERETSAQASVEEHSGRRETRSMARNAKREEGEGGEKASELVITDMIPFWMDPSTYAPRAVPNSVTIGGMVVLTGPNTAGKSTVMRSLCAVSLLGNCGLMVPARAAIVPYQDSYYLRAASYDSPAEGLSSFAVEVLDTATILRDATPHTLVLVDELGKGTETRAGSAIAGAVLEELNRVGCRGLFTTHLHEIFELPLSLGGVRHLRMDIDMQPDSSWSPTWKLVEGRCVDSLAVHAAAKYGLPDKIVQRARGLAALRDSGGLDALVAFGPELDDKQVQVGLQASPSRSQAGLEAAGDGDRDVTMQRAGTVTEESTESAEEEGGGEDSGGKLHKRGGRIPAEARRSLTDATAVLRRVASDLQVSSGDGLIVVAKHSAPPPAAGLHACVYVARTSTGWFYVGETDHLPTRIDVLRGGKSVARRVEAAAIQALAAGGFPLLSRTDALHRQFAADDAVGLAADRVEDGPPQ